MNKVKLRLIDISHHNGEIDFEKVKGSGIDGAIIRTGFGISSPRQKDRRFEEYYTGAKAAGLYVGAYHYSYAGNPSEAVMEAEFMLEIIKGKSFELPFYGDFEEQGKLPKEICTEIVRAFCERLEKSGAWAGVYSYDTFFRSNLSADIPKRFTVWAARVGNIFPECVAEEDIGIWQNSWKGKIVGIAGKADTDMCYRDFPREMAAAGLNIF